MPLFGKKKEEKKQPEKKAAPGGYPTHGAYPTQGNYPTASAPPAPGAPQYGYAPPAPGPGHQEPPPPYTPYASGQAPPPQQYAYPQAQYVAPGPPQPQNVMVAGAFDAGARFDGIAQPNIPPPPPGYMPNAAQVASMQGHNVQATQQTAGWFEGPSGGGYTVW